jgi:hypothetical protein
MSDNPLKDSHAPVADTSSNADNSNVPEVKRKENPNALRRAAKTWLDMLISSTSRKS